MIRKLLRKPYHFMKNVWRLNLVVTLYFNFKVLPFRQAIKLPFHLYGKIYIHSLRGQVCINSPHITSGMIKIGYRWWDLFPVSLLPTQIWIDGKIIFGYNVIVSGGVGLFVQHKDATLLIGNKCLLGGGTLLKSLDVLEIGDYTRITGNCTIMNSNMHYVKNIDNGIVKKPWGKIVIGKYCWINGGTVVTKGTVIPDYSIVARNSFLNKDYSTFGESNLFIVGSPAKVTSARVERIFIRANEREYDKYFRENPNKEELLLACGLEEVGEFDF